MNEWQASWASHKSSHLWIWTRIVSQTDMETRHLFLKGSSYSVRERENNRLLLPLRRVLACTIYCIAATLCKSGWRGMIGRASTNNQKYLVLKCFSYHWHEMFLCYVDLWNIQWAICELYVLEHWQKGSHKSYLIIACRSVWKGWMVSPHCQWGRCSSGPGGPTVWGRRTALVCWCWDPEERPCTGARWGQRRRILEVVGVTKTTEITCNSPWLTEPLIQSFMIRLLLYGVCGWRERVRNSAAQTYSILTFCRLLDRFNQITNLGKCPCCACRGEWNQIDNRWHAVNQMKH